MLQASDVGRLFAVMQANYGHRWPHEPDAIPVWHAKLRARSAADILSAADRVIDTPTFKEFPPSLGEFVDLVRESTPRLPSSTQENIELSDRVYQYTKPQSKTNPKGNPHHVNLAESVAHRRANESSESYEKRIADAVTFVLYPYLRPKFQR